MTYEYSGYLKTILEAPDSTVGEDQSGICFTADELANWNLRDQPFDPEWQHIPVTRKRIDTGIRIEGHFKDVRRIDNLTADDPSFWIALTSAGVDDDRFPIDTGSYPILEVTYRCTSANAHPVIVWSYPGGIHTADLTPTQDWRTVTRRVPHFGFPSQIDALTFRLYTTARDTESVEIQSFRFRSMTPAETKACEQRDKQLASSPAPRHYPVLDEFMPFACYMDAGASKRLASMLGISFKEYWELALEDIVGHCHNCIAIENIDRMTREERRGLLTLAERFDVKFFVIHDIPLGATQDECREIIETYKPYADSPAILAWSLYDEPPEHALPDVLQAKALIEEVDPNHPVAVMMRDPNAFPQYARLFPAVGIMHYGSHVPWQIGDMVRAHQPLCQGRQFWVQTPGFVYATDTPEWHTCPELRLMLNLAMANGVKGWFTFAYHNDPIWIRGSIERSLTGPFLTFSDLWTELGVRIPFYNAIAPLLLQAEPETTLPAWFATRSALHTNAQLPEGIEPTRLHRLHGADYDLYFLVNNEVREMTSLYIDIDPSAVEGQAIYNLSNFFQTQQWQPLQCSTHFEMFPGQAIVLLIAAPNVCAHWRDLIADRIAQNESRQIGFDLEIARAHGLSLDETEALMNNVQQQGPIEKLETLRQIRNTLLSLMYTTPEFAENRSKIIETGALICACDQLLCTLQGQGKVELARQWGFKVVPLAREFINLRIEFRRGKVANITEQCLDLAQRTHDLLNQIHTIP